MFFFGGVFCGECLFSSCFVARSVCDLWCSAPKRVLLSVSWSAWQCCGSGLTTPCVAMNYLMGGGACLARTIQRGAINYPMGSGCWREPYHAGGLIILSNGRWMLARTIPCGGIQFPMGGECWREPYIYTVRGDLSSNGRCVLTRYTPRQGYIRLKSQYF